MRKFSYDLLDEGDEACAPRKKSCKRVDFSKVCFESDGRCRKLSQQATPPSPKRLEPACRSSQVERLVASETLAAAFRGDKPGPPDGGERVEPARSFVQAGAAQAGAGESRARQAQEHSSSATRPSSTFGECREAIDASLTALELR
jgi:hypothetical protein